MTGFVTGRTYPLVDADAFDDDYGEGYAYARVAGDLHGLPMTMVDCWIVDGRGVRHPGIDQCPVPVRIQDVMVDEAFQSPPADYDGDPE